MIGSTNNVASEEFGYASHFCSENSLKLEGQTHVPDSIVTAKVVSQEPLRFLYKVVMCCECCRDSALWLSFEEIVK